MAKKNKTSFIDIMNYLNQNNTFAFGGQVMDQKTPDQVVFDAKRNTEDSALESSGAFAGLQQLAMVLAQKGGESFFNKPEFANGGVISSDTPAQENREVEVEGGETGETPDGRIVDFKGPSHEQGGIDVDAPIGTEIYSDRLSIDDQTMADRKKKREKKLDKMLKLMLKNPNDSLLKNSYERLKVSSEKQDAKDMEVQNLYKQSLNQVQNIKNSDKNFKEKFASGGVVNPTDEDTDYVYNPEFEDNLNFGLINSKEKDINEVVLKGTAKHKAIEGEPMTNLLSHPDIIKSTPQTFVQEVKKIPDFNLDYGDLGNALQVAGNIYSPLAMGKNIRDNRAGDTPNVNYYKNYGQKALSLFDGMEKEVDSSYRNSMQELELNNASQQNQNNLSTRGLNTLRALNMASNANMSSEKRKLAMAALDSRNKISSDKMNALNKIDEMTMKGEASRDLANRADRDAYFQNMNTLYNEYGKTAERLGSQLNDMKKAEISNNIISQLSKHGLGLDEDGKIITLQNNNKSNITSSNSNVNATSSKADTIQEIQQKSVNKQNNALQRILQKSSPSNSKTKSSSYNLTKSLKTKKGNKK